LQKFSKLRQVKAGFMKLCLINRSLSDMTICQHLLFMNECFINRLSDCACCAVNLLSVIVYKLISDYFSGINILLFKCCFFFSQVVTQIIGLLSDIVVYFSLFVVFDIQRKKGSKIYKSKVFSVVCIELKLLFSRNILTFTTCFLN
jgi:hypothetical protein